jgi:soluble lytic murein transglycosylase
MAVEKPACECPSQDQETASSLTHAREILGADFDLSEVATVYLSHQPGGIEDFIKLRLEKKLKERWKPKARVIAEAIMQESRRYGFDPLFLVAMIDQESRFSPEHVGTHGEIGLMQIKPSTADWLASKQKPLRYQGAESLFDPVANIRIGAAYLAQLRQRFLSVSHLYLAAYNMGAFRVTQVMQQQLDPTVYHSLVVKKYLALYAELSRNPT